MRRKRGGCLGSESCTVYPVRLRVQLSKVWYTIELNDCLACSEAVLLTNNIHVLLYDVLLIGQRLLVLVKSAPAAAVRSLRFKKETANNK